jgi:hypothetical protein
MTHPVHVFTNHKSIIYGVDWFLQIIYIVKQFGTRRAPRFLSIVGTARLLFAFVSMIRTLAEIAHGMIYNR